MALAKKVAFLSIYYGAANRGAETFISELSQRLATNYKVDIILGSSTPLKSWPVLWRFFLDPQGMGVLRFTLQNLTKIWKEKYDIVIPIDGGWEALLVRTLTIFYGGKVIISGQSGIGWYDRINIFSFPNAFVPISSKALKWAKKFNPFVKSVYIPNGVDLTRFKPEGRVYKTKLKRPIILTVGALVKSKRIDLVIKAVSRLPKANLLIAGDGDEKESLYKLAQDLISDRFEFVKVKHDQMPEIYRAADCFVLLPVSAEAFGIVYVEALASNLPVVAPLDPQRREIVGEGGILVEYSNSPEDIAYAIQLALEKKWGDKPRNQAQKFNWDDIARKYEELFIKL